MTERKPSLSVLVPVYNEEYLVEASLKRLASLAHSPSVGRVRVVVVDDASTDGTAAALDRFRESLPEAAPPRCEWIFLKQEQNQGKGAAVRTALAEADTDLVVVHDADLEYHPGDLEKMIPLFESEEADAVYGSRFLPGEFRRVLLFRHSLGNLLVTLLTNLITDLNLSDVETGYKMLRTSLLKSIPIESDGFGIEPELTIKLAKREARIFEVPIRYSGRTYREGKKLTWRDGVQALGALLRFAISDRIYSEDEHGSQILARLNRAPRFTKWMADTIRPYLGERILELGAGIGNLTANLVPRTVYCVSDVNPLYLERLRAFRNCRPYLHVHYTDAQKAETFPTEKFDTVVCLNVIEHLEEDTLVLRNIREALVRGGRAIILVPNGPGLYGSLDRVLGHCRRYRRAQLVEKSEQAGFQVETILKFNRMGAPGWWWNGRVLKKETFDLWQMKLLNLLVPLLRPIDRFLPFPHLSWIAVLRKKEPVEGPAGAG